MLGSSGAIDHADCRRHLAAISYRKWVTLKQRETLEPLDGLAEGIGQLLRFYLREDNLAMRRRRQLQAAAGNASSREVVLS